MYSCLEAITLVGLFLRLVIRRYLTVIINNLSCYLYKYPYRLFHHNFAVAALTTFSASS